MSSHYFIVFMCLVAVCQLFYTNMNEWTNMLWTGDFTYPPQILHTSSLPGFADGDQQTELNQTLPKVDSKSR